MHADIRCTSGCSRGSWFAYLQDARGVQCYNPTLMPKLVMVPRHACQELGRLPTIAVGEVAFRVKLLMDAQLTPQEGGSTVPFPALKFITRLKVSSFPRDAQACGSGPWMLLFAPNVNVTRDVSWPSWSGSAVILSDPDSVRLTCTEQGIWQSIAVLIHWF